MNPKLGASTEAIQHHYDLGDDFYECYLGSPMVYSAAMWEPGDDIVAAQNRKIDFHIAQAQAAQTKRVLDIGCGWGTLLRRLVDTHGVEQAVGLTLSPKQAANIRQRAHPRVAVELMSWTDYRAAEPFDAIISLGAFEHFARADLGPEAKIDAYRAFFRKCHELLKPGGRMSLQTMAFGNFARGDHSQAFIAQEIYRESDMPRLADIARSCEMLFEVVQVRNDRMDYAKTMRDWFDRLTSQRARAVAVAGDEAYERYRKYLRMFSYSFEMGAFELLRVTFRRMDRRYG
jgi:cyclopropane-fatty-acyl-phospholipid synthase